MGANRDQFALIENISAISGEAAADLRETLDKIVAAIAEGMEVEVCSLYLFDPQRERLVLRATIGLDRDSVGKVSMRTNEGLVGLVDREGRGSRRYRRDKSSTLQIFPRDRRGALSHFSRRAGAGRAQQADRRAGGADADAAQVHQE